MSFAENRRIALVTLVVDDYDRAKAFYCEVLGFEYLSDQPLGDGKRWLVVKPQGTDGCALLLAEADGEPQRLSIGNQTGGRVGFFLNTDDFQSDYETKLARGVHFLEEPRHEVYGSVAVFVDPYGNRWDLLQPRG